MLAGTPYHRPAALAASKLSSYMTPAMHTLASSEETTRWAVGARAIQPLLKPAFPLNPSPGDSLVDAHLRCERTNARLRSALSLSPSDPDHAYTCALGSIRLEHVTLMTSSTTTPCLTLRYLSVCPPRKRSTPLLLSSSRQVRNPSRRPGCSRWHATPRPSTPRSSSVPLSASKICSPGLTRSLTT
eukprot:1047312-Pleurochrysis_carterae.AAC.2